MKKHVILFLAANPAGTDRLALDREARSIHMELKRSGYRDRFEFVTRWAAEPLDLLREVRELKPTVVHFSGHGGHVAGAVGSAPGRDVVAALGTPSSAQPGLYFQDSSGGSQAVSPEAIAQTLGAAGASVKVVVLNACFTEPIAEALLAHVDCVVGMSGSIHDDAARSFAIGFYGGLGEHESVAAACEHGRAAIRLDGMSDAERPKLKVRDGFDATELILAAVEPSLRSAVPCPYPGMRPYTADDASAFHGRGKEIQELVRRLRAGERDLYIIGPSGSGKSSLVAAGLLPRLARGVTGLGPLIVRDLRPGERPATRLAQVLDAAPGKPFVPADSIAAMLAHRGPGTSVLIVVDQLEELFTQSSADEREAFLAALREMRAQPRCVAIFTLRADFFGTLMESPLWAQQRGQLSRIEVSPLRGELLREAISAPARGVGVVVEPDLIERLLADAGSEPGILPLLQETMVQLWDERKDQTIALADYEALGDDDRNGLAVALANRADAALRQLTSTQAALARRILVRLISFGEGRPDTRRQQPLSKLRAAANDADSFEDVLQQMIDARLLAIDKHDHDGEPLVDLSHEVIIAAWPALADWTRIYRLDEHRRRQLEAAANLWVHRGSGMGGLYDPVELEEVEQWRRTESARDLGESPTVAAFISASQEARNRLRRQRVSMLVLALAALVAVAILAVRLTIANRSQAERALAIFNLGEVTLEIHAFDWDAADQKARMTTTPGDWRWNFRDANDAALNVALPQELLTRRTPSRIGDAFVEDVDIRGGATYIVVERLGCTNSIVSVRLPGYDADHTRVRIGLRIPTCAASQDHMAKIPAGPFVFGGTGDLSSQTYGRAAPNEVMVDLPDFAIDQTEVTNAAFAVFAEMWKFTAIGPRQYSGSLSGTDEPQSPVSNISWPEARSYCRFLGKDLPTSYEWTKALRGGLIVQEAPNPHPRRILPNAELNVFAQRSRVEKGAIAVGTRNSDLSPYGIYDMADNVEEWTLTAQASKSTISDCPPAGGVHVTHGASWNVPQTSVIDVMLSGNMRPDDTRSYALGMRCVLRY